MRRHYDPLTYRFPRTSIQAFGCDGYEAIALHKPSKAPVTVKDVVCYIAAICLCIASAVMMVL